MDYAQDIEVRVEGNGGVVDSDEDGLKKGVKENDEMRMKGRDMVEELINIM